MTFDKVCIFCEDLFDDLFGFGDHRGLNEQKIIAELCFRIEIVGRKLRSFPQFFESLVKLSEVFEGARQSPVRCRRIFINIGGGAKFHDGFLKFAFLQIFFAAGDVFIFGLTAGNEKDEQTAQGDLRKESEIKKRALS